LGSVSSCLQFRRAVDGRGAFGTSDVFIDRIPDSMITAMKRGKSVDFTGDWQRYPRQSAQLPQRRDPEPSLVS